MKHFQYLWYLIRHKWFVLLAGIKIGVSLWRLVTHDISKFFPSEWFPYVDYFFDKEKLNNEVFAYGFPCEGAPWGTFGEDRFDIAWCQHQHRNDHHYQYWYLLKDDGEQFPVGMPDAALKEMVADWAGAGKAITGKWEVDIWYRQNKHKMKMREEDFERVEQIMTDMGWRI